MADFDDIKAKLKRHKLIPTIPNILKASQELGCWELTAEVESIWSTYQQMLQFMLNGIADPQAASIRRSICSSLETIVCKLERRQRIKDMGHEKYVSTAKAMKNITSFEFIVNQLEEIALLQQSIAEDDVMRDSVRKYTTENLSEQHETALQNLFNWTWTGDIWNNNDIDQANRIILSSNISSDDKAVFVSAITLSILEQYDALKLVFLLDCYLNDDHQLSQRALVGFVLAFHLNSVQAKEDTELQNRLIIYKDDSTFIKDFYATITQLQLSSTTDSVSSKMHNDILPILMQGHMQRMNKDNGINIKELTKNGENPEWIDESKFDKKVREMADLQLDGADVYFSTFAGMKSYSFFSVMPHWFYPFSMDNSLLPDISAILNGKVGKVLKLMLNGAPFCNSDKFSLCYTFKTLGSFAESAIETQISQQLSDAESLDDLIEDAEKTKIKKADIRRHYIFDLYRFFNSYPYHIQFTNPFKLIKEEPITPLSNSTLKALLADNTELMSQYADFLMRKEFYEAAICVFQSIINDTDTQDASILQKYGFCCQKTNRIAQAIDAYRLANELKPYSKWTLSHLATICMNEENYAEAAEYYKALLDIEPENIKYLQNIGKALVNSQQYEEATKHLYKANYLDEGSLATIIQLCWALLFSGQQDKASALINEHISNSTEPELYSIKVCQLLIEHKNREAYDTLVNEIDRTQYPQIIKKMKKFIAAGAIDETTAILLFDNAYLTQLN